MPVALSSIRNELLPGLRKITGKYEEIPAQWPKFYLQKGKSKMAVERTSSMRFLKVFLDDWLNIARRNTMQVEHIGDGNPNRVFVVHAPLLLA